MSWIKAQNDRMALDNSARCLKCMECCKILVIPLAYNADNEAMLAFYKARGHEIQVKNDIPYIVLKENCPHLNLDSGCNIYDNRPEWCRIYDGRFDPFVREKCLWNNGR